MYMKVLEYYLILGTGNMYCRKKRLIVESFKKCF